MCFLLVQVLLDVIILWLYLEQILVVQACSYINITLINDIYTSI